MAKSKVRALKVGCSIFQNIMDDFYGMETVEMLD
jgi:hypothetical protein